MRQAELILALDVQGAEPARRLLDRLPEVRWVKVGSILMTREGPGLVRELADRGLQVFLDLKWHDIPNTVREAVEAARELGAAMATVHTLGGPEMMAAAAEAAAGRVAVVGVTVLTSHSPATYGSAVGRPVPDLAMEVVRQARNAVAAGLNGLVCSPQEAAVVHAAVGAGPLIVVPGIRRPEDSRDDQSRAAGPAEAVRAGATHLVVGRPVLRAADPEAAWGSLLESIKIR
jgi:orotidine-5'-phosphate decarboxylase